MRTGTGVRRVLGGALLAALAAASASAAQAPAEAAGGAEGGVAPPIVRPWRDGLYLMLSTRTGEGRCTARAGAIVCADRDGVATADRVGGCGRVERGGSCTVLSVPGLEETGGEPSRRSDTDEPADVGASEPAESRIDIECEAGPKRGTIYTISDGDGQGACGANRDVDGRVIGGTCTKGGSECGSVDCEHGCGVAAGDCSCQVRSIGRRTMQTDPS